MIGPFLNIFPRSMRVTGGLFRGLSVRRAFTPAVSTPTALENGSDTTGVCERSVHPARVIAPESSFTPGCAGNSASGTNAGAVSTHGTSSTFSGGLSIFRQASSTKVRRWRKNFSASTVAQRTSSGSEVGGGPPFNWCEAATSWRRPWIWAIGT